jgi:ribosome-associated translation inhibitor RaiA
VESYWQTKLLRVERLLQRMPEDQRSLHLVVKHCHNMHEAHAVLALPTGTLVAEARSLGHREVLDALVDRLVLEIRKHTKYIRHDFSYRRKGRRSQAYLLSAAEAAGNAEVAETAEAAE